MILRSWGWFIIIQKTKPLIGQVNLEDELRILEEKANEAYGAYEEQLNTKARLQQENILIKEEKAAIIKQIDAEQGNMSQYTDKQATMSAQKAELEAQLVTATENLAQMEKDRQA